MICQLCKRQGENSQFEKHHLIPMNRKESSTIDVCHQCGDQIHLLFNNHELKTYYNSIESIVENEKFSKYIKWVKSKPIEKHFSVQKKKRK